VTKMQKGRLWLARVLLGGTEHVAVPVKEIQEVERIVATLQQYVEVSGALSDPRKIRARKVIKHLTNALFVKSVGLERPVAPWEVDA